MAWEARSGLKRIDVYDASLQLLRLNGLGGPFGIETCNVASCDRRSQWLNGLGGPFGIETLLECSVSVLALG